MAACVAPSTGGRPVLGSLRLGTRPPKTGSVDEPFPRHGVKSRIRALVSLWEARQQSQNDGPWSHKTDSPARELYRPGLTAPPPHVGPPPSYEDSVADLPPDYTCTEALATVGVFDMADLISKITDGAEKRPANNQTSGEIDWSTLEGARSHANKKAAKKAAKTAQMNKWENDDEGEKKDEGADGGAGDGNAGGGDGGGDGGSGAGGDPPDGGGGNDGGEDGDDWFSNANKKNKKKKKKNAWEEFEDDEKKREEEEAATASKGDDAAANAGTGGTDAGDDWDAFATVGKKGKESEDLTPEQKGKKDALQPVLEPEPAPTQTVDLAASATADPVPEANADEGWGGFTSKGKKKTKKEKEKGKSDPVPAPAAPDNDMKFDDINLDDDAKNAPKLDLDFLGSSAAEPKTSGGTGFSFGSGWGGGWGSGGGGTSWGFGSSDPVAAEKKDDKADDSWSGFGSGKAGAKRDKKEDKVDDMWSGVGSGKASTKRDKKDDKADDAWSSLGTGKTTTKRDKKDDKADDMWSSLGSGKPTSKQDKAGTTSFDFEFDDNLGGDAGDIGSVGKDEKPAEEDSWSGFATSKKDKKKVKKGAIAEVETPFVETPPPPPPVEEKLGSEEPWGVSSTKKDKKTKKKVGSIWDPEPEPAPVIPDPEPEIPTVDDDMWGSSGLSAKDKKKAKKVGKSGIGSSIDDPAVVDVLPALVSQPTITATDNLDDLMATATSKKGKKTTKKSGFDWGNLDDPVPQVPPPPPAAPDPIAEETPADDFFGGWGAPKKDIKKKGKKGGVEELPAAPPPPEPVVEPPPADDWFSSMGKKDKKSKTKKGSEPEPPAHGMFGDDDELMPTAVDEPKADDDLMNSWSTGTKKKPLKKDKSKGITEVVDPSPGISMLQPESVQEKSAEEADPWSAYGNVGKKAKVKPGKKGGLMDPTPPPVPTPPDQGLDDPTTDVGAVSALLDMGDTGGDDPWSFATTSAKKTVKKDKKGVVGRGSLVAEVPKPEEKTKSKKTTAQSPNGFFDIVNEDPEGFEEPEAVPAKVESPKEEKKPTKSTGWGASLWGSSTKTKSAKDKEKEKAAAEEAQRLADEAAFAAALGEDPDDILDIVEEAPPPKKSSKDKDKDKEVKKKGTDKLAKAESKSSSKKIEPKVEPVVEAVDEPDPVDDIAEEPSAAGWGFWGTSLKSAKKATPAPGMKKEIGLDASTNQRASLSGLPKMPEVTPDYEGLKSATLPPKTASTSTSTSKSKAGTKSSVIQDRIKALQGVDAEVAPKKGSKFKDLVSPPPPPPEPESDPEPVVVVPPSPEQKKSSSKDKKSTSATFKTSTSKKAAKEPSPPTDPIVVPPKSTSPLPGGFPLDDLVDPLQLDEMPPSTKKSTTKDKKLSSKPAKKESKSAKPDPDPIVDASNPAFADILDFDDGPAKLPTPPPEKSAKDDSKSSKRDRPKVVRDTQSTSWGFWGATPPPKTSSKSKEPSRTKDETTSPTKPPPPPGLSRSKSARKASDQDPMDKASKSSGSDKDLKSASKSRPSTSRGMSLSGILGMGATPSRSKSTRIPSSRRQSTQVDNLGLMSPPPEDGSRDMSSKAAKVMGVSRGKASRETPKPRKVPDPYPIDDDDDDLIMVDGPEDSAKDMPSVETPLASKAKKTTRRSARESTMMSGGLGADDAVMVDAPRFSDEAKILSGPDDTAFIERPPPLKRSSTTASKKTGLMGGILGAFSSRPSPDRRQSKAYESEDGMSRRKRGSMYDDDVAKRLRRDDRKVNRSRKVSDADGFTDAAPVTETEDAEAKEARRAERRARRAREAADEEARTPRYREKDDARRAKAREDQERARREDEEREEQRKKEERRARRAEREARRAEEDRQAREDEAKAEERRERRRERERQRAEEESAARPKPSDRRRSYMDRPDDDESRRLRREERRTRRSVDVGSAPEKERPRTSRRRSDYPAPAGEYADKRTGEYSPYGTGAARTPPADGRPYMKAGGDKTASWVHSVNDDPPPPPPVEGTIVDAPVHFAADDTPADPSDETTTARELRRKQRLERERAAYDFDPSDRRRRRRDDGGGGVRSSDGSSHERRRSSAAAGGPVNSMGYGDMGGKTWDGRPAMPARRGSWFKKLAGL